MSLSCEKAPTDLHEEYQYMDKIYVSDKFTPKNSDRVNHPAHYTSLGVNCSCGKPIECIDVTRNLNFNIGNAIKYLWRCDLKENAIEDLKKAIWYINDEIKKRDSNK